MEYKSSIKKNPSKILEACFSIFYLIFVFSASIIFFIQSRNNSIAFLYGRLSLILGLGDSFHLIPRILIAIKRNSQKLDWWSGFGLLISSITMTIFYIILFYIWKSTYPDILISPIWPILLWISAILRIILCLFPQNNWFNPKGNIKWSIYRNIPFFITGFCDFYLFLLVKNQNYAYLSYFAPAIFISFACYLPVVLWSKRKPVIGALMIPKTIAYIFMISLGLYFCFNI